MYSVPNHPRASGANGWPTSDTALVYVAPSSGQQDRSAGESQGISKESSAEDRLQFYSQDVLLEA